MLEIEYTVLMDSKVTSKDMGTNVGKRYYEPTTINAIVTVAKNKVTNECGKKAAVTQKFKINLQMIEILTQYIFSTVNFVSELYLIYCG